MSTQKKYSIIIFTLAVIIFPALTPVRKIWVDDYPGIALVNPIIFVLYFFLTCFCLSYFEKKVPVKKIIIALLIGASCLQLPLRIIDFNGSLISLPEYLLQIVSIFLGYLAYKKGIAGKIIIFCLGLLYSVWFLLAGNNLWLHLLNFGTFTGNVNSDKCFNVNFITCGNEIVTTDNFKGQYILLDFWNTYCGVCYQKFPELEELYQKYKNNPQIRIYSVHAWFDVEKEDARKGCEIMHTELENKYSFPNLAISFTDSLFRKLEVKRFPTVLIYDKQGYIIFRGTQEGAKKKIEILLKSD